MPYKDKEKQREYQRKHFANNRVKYAESLRKNRLSKLEYVINQKIGKRCIECGESDFTVLDFHHREPSKKRNDVSYLRRQSATIRILQEEIDKCDLLCRNCHRIIHSKSIKRISKSKKGLEIYLVRDQVSEHKSKNGCKICGVKNPIVLDFHHRKPDDKFKGISKMVRQHYSFATILIEIQKCDVLCANCHIKLHRRN